MAKTVCIVSTLSTLGCAKAPEDTTPTLRLIEDVLQAHNDSLMALPGVVGTAIGRCDGTPCIRVFLADTSSARAGIPARLEGYLVRAEVTGPVRPRDPPPGSEGSSFR